MKKRWLLLILLIIPTVSASHYSYTGTNQEVCETKCVNEHTHNWGFRSVIECEDVCKGIISKNRGVTKQRSLTPEERQAMKDRETKRLLDKLAQEKRQEAYDDAMFLLKNNKLDLIEGPCEKISDDKFIRQAINSLKDSSEHRLGQYRWRRILSAKLRLFKITTSGGRIRCYAYAHLPAEDRFKRRKQEFENREHRRLNIFKLSPIYQSSKDELKIPCPKEVREKEYMDRAFWADVLTVKVGEREIRVVKDPLKDKDPECFGYSKSFIPSGINESYGNRFKCPAGKTNEMIKRWENSNYKEGMILSADYSAPGYNYTFYQTADRSYCFKKTAVKKVQLPVEKEPAVEEGPERDRSELTTGLIEDDLRDAAASDSYDDLYTTLKQTERIILKFQEQGADPEKIQKLWETWEELNDKYMDLKEGNKKKKRDIREEFKKLNTPGQDVSTELPKARNALTQVTGLMSKIKDTENRLIKAQTESEWVKLSKELRELNKQYKENWNNAKKQYEEILDKDFRNPEANFVISKMLQIEGKDTESRWYFQRAIANSDSKPYIEKLQEKYKGGSKLFSNEPVQWTILDPLSEGDMDSMPDQKKKTVTIKEGLKDHSGVILRLRTEAYHRMKSVGEGDLLGKALLSEVLSIHNSYVREKALDVKDVYNKIEKEILKAKKDAKSIFIEYEPKDENKELINRGQ